MNSETHDESQSSLFAFSSPASDDVKLTREDRLLAIVASRPRYLDRSPIGTEHVRWAISELEREGIHPVLKLIIRAIGRGSQREVVPLVDEFYRVAATKPPRHHIDEHGSRLEALYDVVLADARESVRVEFTADRVAMEEAWCEVDAKQASAEATLKEATEALQLAEATKVFALEEMDKSRLEHAAIQEKLSVASIELAKSEQARVAAQLEIEVLACQRDAALSIKRTRDEQLQASHSRLSDAGRREASARRRLAQLVDRTHVLERSLLVCEKGLENERLLSALHSKRLEEASLERTRLGGDLSEVQSRLARSRQLSASLSDAIEELRAANVTALSRLRIEERARASAELERSMASRDLGKALGELEEARLSLSEARQKLVEFERAGLSTDPLTLPRTE
jgi:hypothetical protein